MENDKVLFLVDRKSFPVKCAELDDLYTLVNGNILELTTESPTEFFRRALSLTDEYELVVPVTRNMYIRDRLRQEGVLLVLCL